jgi:Tol biopolymer transport system component
VNRGHEEGWDSKGDYRVKPGRWHLYVDGSVGEGYERIDDVRWSKDGKSVAYVAWNEGKAAVIRDGKAGEWTANVQSLILSPDGSTFAGVTATATRTVVEFGETRAEMDFVDPASFRFSPDGKGFAFRARERQQWFIVVNGKRSKKEDQVYPPQWSPDGKKVGYVAMRREREFHWKVMEVE